ncbi:hypothetical protein CIT31_18370 [Mesorhizobium wenxiniae]|uniref:Uncharacterized protein n=1 Tax=Mesorhizobium wenxiniae TaxID=2014805 RepID=A0A271KET3_9HYPH|nr:PAAR-like domain-containing protein [Mesorhizobium wenxiniae]PAP94273.1 hypothetical protein CIT31_18370 [Mesorhizobium wenxiniae]
MTKNVFAEKWEIAGKNGMNKSIARFPDVCLSPPSPPAGPIPIPYPDTSFSNNLKEGSETVLIGGKPAALAQKSYYKEPMLGNEAATRTFGSSVVTHQITGKTYFQAWCMSVKFEGKNVCRHFDITTSNHASYVGATPPAPPLESLNAKAAKAAAKAGNCPCCGGPLHEWQKDPSTGKAYPVVKEKTFWTNKIKKMRTGNAKQIANKALYEASLKRMLQLKAKHRRLRKAGKPACPNVHNNDNQGCAMYFDIPKGATTSAADTPAQNAKAAFEATGVKDGCILAWETGKGSPIRRGPNAVAGKKSYHSLNHLTPHMAGGCNEPSNVCPQDVMDTGECQEIEDAQTILENVNDCIP